MDLCLLLPVPDDLWHKPHIYAWIGFFTGCAFGIFGGLFFDWPTRFDTKVKNTFGTSAAWIFSLSYPAVYAGLGTMVGQIVALVVVGLCKS